MSGVLPEWAFTSAGADEGELPEGWTEAPLADLVVHATAGVWGKPDGPEEDGLMQVAVLRGADFRDWESDRGESAARRRIPARRLARLRLQAGDIVIETSGGSPRQPVGRTLLIGAVDLARAARPWICTNFCRLLRLSPEVDPAFVQMALAHLYHTGGFERFQTQTTNLRNLRFPDFLAGVVLPLPPIAEQRRIADRVPELLGRIARLRSGLPRLVTLLARERQALLTAAFTGRLSVEPTVEAVVAGAPAGNLAAELAAAAADRLERFEQSCREAQAAGLRKPRQPAFLSARPWRSPDPLSPPEVPAGWELRSLADLLVRVQQGTSQRAESGIRGGIAVLRMGNIQHGRLDWRDLKHLAPTAAAELAPFFLAPGDLLFNRTNSPELVGKAAVFDGEQPAVFASYLIRLTLDPRLADSRWVAFWINSPWGRLWARAVRTEGVSQSNINAEQLLSLPVPVPPLAEQREIVRLLEAQSARTDAVEARIAAIRTGLERLAQRVVTQALAGELVPSEAALARLEGREWEPGAALLERLRGPWPRPVTARRRRVPAAAGRATLHRPEWVLAHIRRVCWRAEPMGEEELLRRLARRLRVRLDRTSRPQLAAYLETALSRRIVAYVDGTLHGATPTFGDYAYDFLIGILRGVMRRPDAPRERADLTRAVAGSLGFSQVTGAMRDRMEEVFRAGLAAGVLLARDGGLAWIG